MHNGIAKEARKIEANTLLRRDVWKRFSEYGFLVDFLTGIVISWLCEFAII